MKISVSLTDEDVTFLDHYAGDHGGLTRSAALHVAIERLRTDALDDAYAAAAAEWRDSGEAAAWESTVADGIGR